MVVIKLIIVTIYYEFLQSNFLETLIVGITHEPPYILFLREKNPLNGNKNESNLGFT